MALVLATKYTPLPKRTTPGNGAPAIHVRQPRRARESFVDWLNRELKEGGWLYNYLRREKAMGPQRMRNVAVANKNFQQNMKSDLQLRCVLPARNFFRLRAMDPHFFEDDRNIKNLIRDNPEVRPWKA